MKHITVVDTLEKQKAKILTKIVYYTKELDKVERALQQVDVSPKVKTQFKSRTEWRWTVLGLLGDKNDKKTLSAICAIAMAKKMFPGKNKWQINASISVTLGTLFKKGIIKKEKRKGSVAKYYK
jgi:hypothetical protein